jgi:hypothetical protein
MALLYYCRLPYKIVCDDVINYKAHMFHKVIDIDTPPAPAPAPAPVAASPFYATVCI